MAQWEAYSWLAVAATCPLAVSVVFWCLAVVKAFISRSRRHRLAATAGGQLSATSFGWSGFDLVVGAVLASQAADAILAGSWAVLHLSSNDGAVPASVVATVIGVGAALRALRLTTLASLAVDAALKVRRPRLVDGGGNMSYRLLTSSSIGGSPSSPPRGGALYHLFVLTVVSILVGVAACLALPSSSSSTTVYHGALLPLMTSSSDKDIDLKHCILLLAVEAPLLIVILSCLVYVQVKICTKSTSSSDSLENRGSSDRRLRHMTSSDTSTASTSASRRSAAAEAADASVMDGTNNRRRHEWTSIGDDSALDKGKSASMISIKSSSRASSSTGRRRAAMTATTTSCGGGLEEDLRWGTVVTVAVLWTFLDFGPHLVCTIMGVSSSLDAIPKSLPLELAYATATILTTVLLPMCLVCVDPLLKGAAKYTFSTSEEIDTSLMASEIVGAGQDSSSVTKMGIPGLHEDVIGAADDDVEVEIELGNKMTSSPVSTGQSNKKRLAGYDVHGYRIFPTSSIPRKESGIKFPLTNGSLFAASSASTLLSHPSSTFKPSGTSTFSSNKSSSGSAAASTIHYHKPGNPHQTAQQQKHHQLAPPDLSSIWVPPPPANPPPPMSSRTSTISSRCDGGSDTKSPRRQSRGTSPCSTSNESQGNRAELASVASFNDEHLYMSLPEPQGPPLSSSSSSSSTSSSCSTNGEDDGKCNSFTTDAKNDFVFRRPVPPPPPPRNRADVAKDPKSARPEPGGGGGGGGNKRRRRAVGKKTPSKRQRTPLETLDEGIPPPKDFEDSSSVKLKAAAAALSSESDNNDTSSAGSVRDLILRVGAMKKTRSRTSLIGIDNPVFQPDNHPIVPSKERRRRRRSRSKSGDRANHRDTVDDGFQIYRLATPRSSQGPLDSRSLFFGGKRCWQTSLSMNALDSIGLEDPGHHKFENGKMGASHGGGSTLVLPARSGSSLSLYGVDGSDAFSPPYMPMHSFRHFGHPPGHVAPHGGRQFAHGNSSQELRKMSGSRGVVASLLKRQQQQHQLQLQLATAQAMGPLVFHSQDHQQVRMMGPGTVVPAATYMTAVETAPRRVVPVMWPHQQADHGNSTSVPDVRRVFYSEYL